MNLQLHGKKALITGASRGLGYATALSLAAEGANVGINSRSVANLQSAAVEIEKQTSSKIIQLAGDVSEPEIPLEIVEQFTASAGGLDILITNAGGPPASAFEELNDQDWYSAAELSLFSQIRLVRAALPHLRKSSAASVLAITSISARQPIPNMVLSNSLRAAVHGMIKTLALDLSGDGIRFNAILPTWTDTGRVSELMRFRASKNNTTVEEEVKSQVGRSPLGRMCTPEEFARAATFLVSPAASYFTGTMLSIDGGTTAGVY